MKSYKLLFLIMGLILLAFSSCEDETTDNVSFVTKYPDFTLEGEEIMFVTTAQGYTEPGVTAVEGDTPLDVIVTGEVDASTPGFYEITYSATNSDGYEGSVTRGVIVATEDISAIDLSGTYLRGTTTNVVTRAAPGYYNASNGSGDVNNVRLFFVHIGGDELLLPLQSSPYGDIIGTGKITDTGYTMAINFLAHSITLNRTFVKQ